MVALVILFCMLMVIHPAHAAKTKHRYPMSTTGTYVTAYLDHDSTKGKVRDWNGGTKTYDGHGGSDYGVGGFSGMDKGVDVVAGADGTVVKVVDGYSDRCTSGKCSPCNGNYVKVKHADGSYSYYLHLRKGSVSVTNGQQVKCGDKLGQVGSSGCSTGPHLHFQINVVENNREKTKDPFTNDFWNDKGTYKLHPSTKCVANSGGNNNTQKLPCSHAITFNLGSSNLNIRPQSNTSQGKIGSIPNNTCIELVDIDKNGQDVKGNKTWFKIKYSGITGWVSSYYAKCSNCGGPSSCTNGDKQSCYSGSNSTKNVGLCKEGTQTCSNGSWGSCQGEVKPSTETCDGDDNDCDGKTDESLKKECSTACGKGEKTCTNGTWSSCVGPQAQQEVCDGKDNNCNGQVDEGNPEGGRSCSSASNGCQGTFQCTSGKLVCKASKTPSAEICDGKDNDCDGQIDESIQRSCYTGPANTNGVGVCKGGLQKCVSGQWSGCVGQVTPTSKDTCGDGSDNNCNGSIDEGCEKPGCKEGAIRDCYTGPTQTRNVGTCNDGQQTCSGGKWTVCLGQSLPETQERCDDKKDNNCDGIIDEGCNGQNEKKCEDKDKDGYGVGAGCKEVQDCNDNDKSISPGTKEICGNGKDDDCKNGDRSCDRLHLGEVGCKQSSDCVTGLCARLKGEHRCSKSCTKDEDCPQGFTCYEKKACWPSESDEVPESDFVKPCSKDTDCKEGNVCEKGFCKEQQGCGCSTTPSSPAEHTLFWFAFFLLWLVRRRQKTTSSS